MRQELEKILKDELRFLAISTRNHLNLTQKEMENRLQMSESSYSDIETGKSMCGTLTAFLLLDMQNDPTNFIQRTMIKFAECYEKEMQTI